MDKPEVSDRVTEIVLDPAKAKPYGYVLADNSFIPGLFKLTSEHPYCVTKLYFFRESSLVPLSRVGRGDVGFRDPRYDRTFIIESALNKSNDLVNIPERETWFFCPDKRLNPLSHIEFTKKSGLRRDYDHPRGTGVMNVFIPSPHGPNTDLIHSEGPDTNNVKRFDNKVESALLKAPFALRLVLGTLVDPRSGSVPANMDELSDLFSSFNTPYTNAKKGSFELSMSLQLNILAQDGFFDELKKSFSAIEAEDFFAGVAAWQTLIALDMTAGSVNGYKNELPLFPPSALVNSENESQSRLQNLDIRYLPFLARAYVEYLRAIPELVMKGKLFPYSEAVRYGQAVQTICEERIKRVLGARSLQDLKREDPEDFLTLQEIYTEVNLALAEYTKLGKAYKESPELLNRTVGIPTEGRVHNVTAFRNKLRRHGARAGSKLHSVPLDHGGEA